jgi:hypothetical protein
MCNCGYGDDATLSLRARLVCGSELDSILRFNMRILLVEDDDAFASALGDGLSARGVPHEPRR